MFEISSETGWFKYKGSEVPDKVIKHLKNRSDVHDFTQDGSDVMFYSQDGKLPSKLYDEDGENGFKDYGTLFSDAIDKPNNLPDKFQDIIPVDEYFNDDSIIELIEAIGISGDPRNYIQQHRIRFDTQEDYCNPLSIDVLNNHQDKIVSNTRTNYPSLEQINTINEELDKDVNDIVNFAVIGFYEISKSSIRINIDGIAVRTESTSKIKKWFKENLDGKRNDLFRYDEIHVNDSWVRVWCD